MTLALADARTFAHAEEVPLVVVTLMNGVVLRFSDRDHVDASDNQYFPQLMEISEIETEVSLESDSLAADFSMRLKNIGPVYYNDGTEEQEGGLAGYEYPSLMAIAGIVPLAGAEVRVSYVLKANGDQTVEVLAFVGASESPRDITGRSMTLRCSGVAEYKTKAFLLAKMFSENYPLCLPSDNGKVFPYLVGQYKTIECLRARWPIYETDNETQLNGAISSSATTIVVDSTVGFGDSGDEEKVIWIEWERIVWTAKTTTPQQFTGCIRGTAGGTAAASHADNVAVTEHPETTAAVVFAAHDIVSLDALHGEYADQLAPIDLAVCTVTLDPALSYVVIPKSALIVPPTLVDTIQVTAGELLTYNEYPAENNGFNSTSGSSQKTFNWPSDPYKINGIKQYTDCFLKVTYRITELPFISWPTGTPSTKSVSAYVYVGGVNVWGGTTQYNATGGNWVSYVKSRNVAHASPYSKAQTWGASVTVKWELQGSTNIIPLFAVDIEAAYCVMLNANAVTKTGTVTDEKYFRRIYASGWGLPSSNAIYGTVGTAISRPDHVMKSWIIEKLGFTSADIDTASFDAAGTWYAAQSPAFALSVRVTERVDPLATLQSMAFQSCSVCYYSLGKWYLKVIPSTEPTSAKTITRGGNPSGNDADLRGEQADYHAYQTPVEGVVNQVTVRWDRNDGPTGATDPYRSAKQITSIVGDYPTQERTLDLDMVYGGGQAMAVGNLYLARHNRIFLVVEFELGHDATDLDIGDTATLADTTGRADWSWGTADKFYVTAARREGIVRAAYTAIELWT